MKQSAGMLRKFLLINLLINVSQHVMLTRIRC